MPALGFNQYDKFMAGVLLHNYSLPPQKLQFIATALYGFGSSKINSIGRIGYAIYPAKLFDKVVLSASWENFSSRQSKDTLLKKRMNVFQKLPRQYVFIFRKPTKQQQYMARI